MSLESASGDLARRLRPRSWAIVLVAVALVPVFGAPPAAAADPACGASTATITPLHSPDGVRRPFYGDFGSGSTLHSGYVGYQLGGTGLGADPWLKFSGFSSAINLGTNQSASVPSRSASTGGAPLVYAYLKASAASSSAQSFTVQVWNGKPGLVGSSVVCATTDGFSSVEDIISAAANKITGLSASTTTPTLGGSFDVTATGSTGTIGAGISTDKLGGNGVISLAPAMVDSWPADAFTLTGVSVTVGGTTTNDKLRIYPGTGAAGAYSATYRFAVRGTTSGSTAVRPVQSIASGTQVKYTGTYDVAISVAAPVQTTVLAKSVSSVTGSSPYTVAYEVLATNSGASPVTLDYLSDTPVVGSSASWSFLTGTATAAGATIPDPSLDSGTLVFAGPYTVPAKSGGADGSLRFTYQLSVTGPVSNSVSGQVGGQVLTTTGGSTGNQVSVDPTAPTTTTTTTTSTTTTTTVATTTTPTTTIAPTTTTTAPPTTTTSTSTTAAPTTTVAPSTSTTTTTVAPTTVPTTTSVPASTTTVVPTTVPSTTMAPMTTTTTTTTAAPTTTIAAPSTTTGTATPPTTTTPPAAVQPPQQTTTGATPRTFELANLPAEARVSVDPAEQTPGLASVTIHGDSVTVTPSATFSGVLRIPLLIEHNGVRTSTAVSVIVNPTAVAAGTYSPDSAAATTIEWRPSPNAVSYEVRINDVVICSTTTTSCPGQRLIGPKSKVTVTALGNDGTVSTTTVSSYKPDRLIPLLRVHFATASNILTKEERRRIDLFAMLMVQEGFTEVQLDGHTDVRGASSYNQGLSRRRARAVEAYLSAKLRSAGVTLRATSHSFTQPTAPNNTAIGRAANRRVEVGIR